MGAAITLPEAPRRIIEALESQGHAAYAVGGCVRDSLRGETPKDWDICVSAYPEEAGACLLACLPPGSVKTLPTGLRHGGFTALMEGTPYEITAFRSDGPYSDCRRPDSVRLGASLEEDLARRDFTVNSMAYNHRRGLVDPFGGGPDLEKRLLRAVGDPSLRFREDALRILRALRLAATLGFSLESATGAALHDHRGLLARISPERVSGELSRLLLAPSPAPALEEYFDVAMVFLPELARHGDAGKARALAWLAACPRDLATRLAALLAFPDEKPRGADPARAADALRRLRFPGRVKAEVAALLMGLETPTPPEEAPLRRLLRDMGPQRLAQLLDFKLALAQAAPAQSRNGSLASTQAAIALADEILREGRCYSLPQLAVSGHHLAAQGVPQGPQTGAALDWLLEQVVEGRLPNERQALLKALSIEALTRFAQQIVGRSHARIPKICDFVESTAEALDCNGKTACAEGIVRL